MRDFGARMTSSEDGSWECICRACRSVQFVRKDELICSRDQLCRVLDAPRVSMLDRVLPENPRPRMFGEAGRVDVEDLKAVMGR